MQLTFAAAASGRSYVGRFLEQLSALDRSWILAVFREIENSGLEAKGCQFRQIEGKLWEIKIKAPNAGYRFFYVMVAKDHMRILHAYKKQGQKTPIRELELPRRRLRETTT